MLQAAAGDHSWSGTTDPDRRPSLEEVSRAVEDGVAWLRGSGARRRYPLWRHLIARTLASATILVYLVAMGFAKVPRLGAVLARLRDWWLVLRCAWLAGPLVLAHIGVIGFEEALARDGAGGTVATEDVLRELLKPSSSRRFPH